MVKVRYVCESCQNFIEDMDLTPGELDTLSLAGLTAGDQRDIIKEYTGENPLLIPSLCEMCLGGFETSGGEE